MSAIFINPSNALKAHKRAGHLLFGRSHSEACVLPLEVAVARV